MSLYRHIHVQLTREQAENYIRLARHLVLASREPDWDPTLFDMAQTAVDMMTGDWLSPEQVVSHGGRILSGALGHAPQAGIVAAAGETWQSYAARCFAAERDSPYDDWLFSSSWSRTDNTPTGAALRLMYVLDYGVPSDWESIIEGRSSSDYIDNGFLWERLGLMPPDAVLTK